MYKKCQDFRNWTPESIGKFFDIWQNILSHFPENMFISSETAVRRYSWKEVSLKIWQYLQENTSVGVPL